MSAQRLAETATEIHPAADRHNHSTGRLDQVLARFTAIALQDMEDVALLDRTDTKLLLTQDQLNTALHHLVQAYRVLEIEGQRQHHYQTLY